MTLLAAKILCLFIGTSYGASWMVKAFRGQALSDLQTGLMTGGIIGFVTLQWLL